MGNGDEHRRRVLIPQALGADEFLRVTWHARRRVVVFSHWQGDTCIAATPVRVEELGELAELVDAAVATPPCGAGWAPPAAATRVAPGTPARRTA